MSSSRSGKEETVRKRILVLVVVALSAVLGGWGQVAARGTADLPPNLVGVQGGRVALQAAGQPAEDVTGTGRTITFHADGRTSGSGGCNQFSGGYTADANGALTFSPLASTLRLCDPATDTRERQYFATLQIV